MVWMRVPQPLYRLTKKDLFLYRLANNSKIVIEYRISVCYRISHEYEILFLVCVCVGGGGGGGGGGGEHTSTFSGEIWQNMEDNKVLVKILFRYLRLCLVQGSEKSDRTFYYLLTKYDLAENGKEIEKTYMYRCLS